MKKLIFPLLILALLLAACTPSTPAQSSGSAIGIGTPPPTLQPGTVLHTAEPSTWGPFGLTGRLILIEFDPDGNRLLSLNLATGAMTLLYQAPQRSLLTGAVVSPDGGQIVLTYAPPPATEGAFTLPNLYLMPSDGSRLPEPFIHSVTPNDGFYNTTWSPDGRFIYTSHYILGDSQTGSTDQYAIDKLSLDGQVTPVIQNAVWPAISPDGTKIAYLTASAATTTNNLYQANIDGSNASPAIPPGAFASVDAHLFAPDGKSLIFSAVNPTASISPARSWLEKLLGIEVASAHNVPSDWYEQPASGGNTQRLTQVADTGMNGALSPDGKDMVFIGAQGLYDYNFASGKAQVLSTLQFLGTVSWLK